MADEKKKPGGPKKDDKKPSGGGSGGGFPGGLALLIAIIVAIVYLTYLLSGRSFFGDDLTAPPTLSDISANLGGASHLAPGDTVANLREVVVRRNLADAAPLGTQAAGARGTLVEGPETAFGRNWWFVDYRGAPDGWVESSQITDRTVVATATNAPSLAVGFLRPIFVALCFVLAAAIVWIWWKKRDAEAVVEKRKEEERRSYLARKGLAASVPAPAATPPEGSLDGLPVNLPTGLLPEGWLDRRAAVATTSRPAEPERWRHAKVLLTSTSQSDWRQAIIEADIILEEMLRAIGYDGTTIGDMLKNVEPSDFATIEKAWDAHKVRNQIAHRGSDFTVTRQDAQSVLNKYEDVFREFNYI
ncbi:MAG TPA: hypothetical protein VJJ47_01000 [Candidatus Paceibacterota bacterium]